MYIYIHECTLMYQNNIYDRICRDENSRSIKERFKISSLEIFIILLSKIIQRFQNIN